MNSFLMDDDVNRVRITTTHKKQSYVPLSECFHRGLQHAKSDDESYNLRRGFECLKFKIQQNKVCTNGYPATSSTIRTVQVLY